MTNSVYFNKYKKDKYIIALLDIMDSYVLINVQKVQAEVLENWTNYDFHDFNLKKYIYISILNTRS